MLAVCVVMIVISANSARRGVMTERVCLIVTLLTLLVLAALIRIDPAPEDEGCMDPYADCGS
jgi:hypothetical protein